MPEIYWYISKAKLELLKEPGLLEGVSVKLGFHLAGFSGEVSGSDSGNLTRELNQAIKHLSESGQTFKDFNELGDDEATLMVRFEGKAVRHVTGEEYWLAMEGKRTALLLAGCLHHESKFSRFQAKTANPRWPKSIMETTIEAARISFSS
jgi:hypothetical protein